MFPKITKEFWRRRIIPVALGLGLGLSVFTGSCWWHIFYYHSASCSEYKPDFVAFYSGAKLMWEERSSLYDLDKQLSVQKPIDPSHADWVLPYVYPPFFALFLMPLAWMSFSGAFAVLTVTNLLLVVSSLILLRGKLRMSKQQSQWLVLSTLCNFGVHYAILEGQTSGIALLLLTLFVLASVQNQTLELGFWSGLISFKPQLLFAPTLILLSRPRWRALVSFAAVVVALFLLSYGLVGQKGMKDYLTLTGQAITRKDIFRDYPERMHNLRALVYFLFPLRWRDYVWWGASVVGFVSFVRLCRIIPKDDPSLAVKWIKIFLAIMLLTPHFHDHDLTLMIIPTAFILKLYGKIVPSYVSLSLVVIGLLPLLRSTLNVPLLPVMPIIFTVLFFTNLKPKKSVQIETVGSI
jgi:Glycosyltransferase family 87